MRDIGVRELALLCTAIVLAASACVTRGATSSQKTLDGLRAAVESGPTPAQRLRSGEKEDADTLGYSLHASGRVRCGGFIRKWQTAYLHAWATHPGPEGERVDVPVMRLSFQYLDGLFAGAELSRMQNSVEEISIAETIVGVGDFCSCIYAIADATLLNTTHVQVKQKICPE